MLDITFEFRSDSSGRDPDMFSPTLRQYHKVLWSKPLPCGALLGLNDATPGAYLYHQSSLGEFSLGSDLVIPTFSEGGRIWLGFQALTEEEQRAFEALTYTIGGMMVFPANRIERRMTINGARGCHPRIRDRFDLTIECIRRHYRNQPHPLSAVLARYADFFALFVNFRGFIEFFLLQDLVTDDQSEVRFFLPFENFAVRAAPTDVDAYRTYWRHAFDFVQSRNERIRAMGLGVVVAAGGHVEA